VQAEKSGELGADRHFPPFAALAVLDDHHPFNEADILDPERHELRDPSARLQKRLHHHSHLTAVGVGMLDEEQLLLERQSRRRSPVLLGRFQSDLAAGCLEHGLGLSVVEPFPGDQGRNLAGYPLDVADHGLAKVIPDSKLNPA
jgi:hypothetical protein